MSKPKALRLGRKLRALRLERSVTQSLLAAKLGIDQSALSHAERRDDALLSTVAAYVSALGGELRLTTNFDGRLIDLLDPSSVETVALSAPSVDQVQLSLFTEAEDGSPQPGRDIIFSIHPEHSKKILSGKKTVELRRRFANEVAPGTRAYIYTTSPTRALTGSASIKAVIRLPLNELWSQFRQAACLSRKDFDAYFDGRQEGFAIMLNRPEALARPIGLSELRERCGFAPPQSYYYAPDTFRNMLAHGQQSNLN